MSKPILHLQDVSYKYPGTKVPVLENINLEILPGEFVGIVGANGSGRSTLCYTINGIVPHSLGGKLQGNVNVRGLDIAKSTTAEVAQWVGLVFSDPEAQLTQFTVADEVAFGPSNLGIPREEILAIVRDTLRLVQLNGLEERNTHTLSGGQQQRLAIASVLAMKPEILVLDEPTSNLDPDGVEEVFSIVTKLNRENQTTVIMVEHHVDLLAEYASRILLMKQGRIIADGPPEVVFSHKDLLDEAQVQVPQVTEVFFQLQAYQQVGVMGNEVPVTIGQGIKQLSTLFSPQERKA